MKIVTAFYSQCVIRKAKYSIRSQEMASVTLLSISSRMYKHTINHHQNLGDCRLVTGILTTAKINDFFQCSIRQLDSTKAGEKEDICFQIVDLKIVTNTNCKKNLYQSDLDQIQANCSLEKLLCACNVA